MKLARTTEVLNARRASSLASAVASTLVACSALCAPGASAIPTSASVAATDAVSKDHSRLTAIEPMSNRRIRLEVYSAAMDHVYPVEVQLPADNSRPRPTLYLLSGAGGGVDDASWQAQSDVREFMADKNVNLVMPLGGKFSYYTNWDKDDPTLGRNEWRTYLGEELPPIIDKVLGTNGVNAIAGISTSATTVLDMPIAEPGLYKAVAAYSGCVQTSDPIGSRFVKVAVAWGGGNAENMWGPAGSPQWRLNDPYLQAEKLRGLDIYMSSGNGLPGRYDVLNGPHAQPGPGGLANQILIGGLIESATNYCTHNMKTRLDSLGIPATYDFTAGTHSWGYWQDEFKRSWPVLARGLGV
jgi:diacylglycerol O-acyltransferase / trehalose O-mycolyltransferase